MYLQLLLETNTLIILFNIWCCRKNEDNRIIQSFYQETGNTSVFLLNFQYKNRSSDDNISPAKVKINKLEASGAA